MRRPLDWRWQQQKAHHRSKEISSYPQPTVSLGPGLAWLLCFLDKR
jgi:hypothetical protein